MKARSVLYKPVTEHENLNLKHTKVVAKGSVVKTELGRETVRIQSPERSDKI